MFTHNDLPSAILRAKIKTEKIRFAGNRVLKIFGKLSCKSGKRMKKENRVFFSSKAEAIKADYRPCGHCMHEGYQQWKHSKKRVE
jgi:methylphosphotriester-DNA--protein-cysteine methyltransferase